MSNFKSVFKVLFTKSYSSNKNSKKNISFQIIISLLAILFFFLSCLYNILFYFAFSAAEHIEIYPLIMSMLVFLITVITSIFRSQIILFSTKDHAILTPMPINKKTIITSKVLLFYLEELIFSIIILLPTIFLYSSTDIWFIVFGILLMLTIPFISVLISSFIGFAISLLTNRFRAAKVLFSILYIVFFIAIMVLFMSPSFSSSGGEEIENFDGLIDGLKNFFLLDWINKGFIEHNVLYVILLMGISLVSAITLIVLYAIFYDSFYNMLLVSSAKKAFKQKYITVANPIKTIFAKDFKHYFSSPLVLLNSITGGICSVIIIVLMSLNLNKNSGGEDFAEIQVILKSMMPFVICIMCGMTSVTAFCISLENKNFWMIKTFPIRKKDFVIAKVLENHVLNGTLALISSILVCIFMKESNVISIIFTILFPQLYIFTFSLLGMIINLCLPKLNWDNFNQIKNSPSLLIYTFGTMLIGIIFVVMISFLSFINQYLGMIVSLLIVITLGIIFALILKKKTGKLLAKIDC